MLLECEEWKKDKKTQKKQPQTVHLYNLIEIRRLSKGQYAKHIQQLQFSIPAPSRKPIFNSNKNIRKVDKKKMQDLLSKAPAVQSHRRGANFASTNNIADNAENFNPDVNNNETLNQYDEYQENLFYDNITPKKLNSMNIKGSYIPAENLSYLRMLMKVQLFMSSLIGGLIE